MLINVFGENMEINKVEMYGGKELYLLGDVHLPRGCVGKFKAVIDEIKHNPKAVAILMGDYIEGINHRDPRYHPEETYVKGNVAETERRAVASKKRVTNLVSDQFDEFEQLIAPIADKIIGLHAGNHEDKLVKHSGINELRRICKRLGIRYYDSGTALTSLQFPSGKVTIQSSHGTGGGYLAGAAYNKMDRTSNYFEGVDIVAKGHTHKLGINCSVPPMKYVDGKLVARNQYQCTTGSFLTNYVEGVVGYGERAEFAPLPIGYIKVFIEDGKVTSVTAVPV